jgi:hypothetical protein
VAKQATFSHLEWESHSDLGGYPLFYLTADMGVLCPCCANENMRLTLDGDDQWRIVAVEINYEDEDLMCDNCYQKIASAYGEET